MTEAERTRLLDAAFDQGPEVLENFLAVLEARLRAFEQRYEIPTTALAAELAAGRLRDTADVSQWLFLAHLQSGLGGQPQA